LAPRPRRPRAPPSLPALRLELVEFVERRILGLREPQHLLQFFPEARVRDRVNHALRGKARVVELALCCVLARGHLLLEDLPGLGKTTLAKALASSIGGRFARVQCTPDLMPTDLTGFNMLDQRTREFQFVPGPVFADVLLADELNRATPRTQSAMLEAMAERQVTVDNVLRTLPSTFTVIATQNPADHHGTYPIPTAQLDRFAVKLSIGYPGREAELDLLSEAVTRTGGERAALDDALTTTELESLQKLCAAVTVRREVQEYLLNLVDVVRHASEVTTGLSPRGVLQWQRLAQAHAMLRGRAFVTPDDVQDVAFETLWVRLGLGEGETRDLLNRVLEQTTAPA